MGVEWPAFVSIGDYVALPRIERERLKRHRWHDAAVRMAAMVSARSQGGREVASVSPVIFDAKRNRTDANAASASQLWHIGGVILQISATAFTEGVCAKRLRHFRDQAILAP
jgi:hypothetical protein